jgi:hypothetical protein
LHCVYDLLNKKIKKTSEITICYIEFTTTGITGQSIITTPNSQLVDIRHYQWIELNNFEGNSHTCTCTMYLCMYVHSFNIFRLIWYLEKAGVINKHHQLGIWSSDYWLTSYSRRRKLNVTYSNLRCFFNFFI